MVKRTLLATLIALAIVTAACAEGEVSGADETTTTAAATTTQASAAETTTTAPTTTEPPAPGDDVAKLLETLSATTEITSGRVEGSVEMTGLDVEETGVREIAFAFASSFDADTGNGSFVMDMSDLANAVETDPADPFAGMAAGMFGTMEFRQVGDRSYMNAPFLTAMFGAQTPWVSMPAEDGDDFSSGFEQVPTDPGEIIDAYENADASVEDLGSEEVNGVDATHYRITFDTSALIEELTPQERAELEASRIFADGMVPIDLWVSAEGYLVRMLMEIDASMAPESDVGTMRLQYDMFDIGGPVVIEAPPEDEVTAIEDLDLLGFDLDLGGDA